MTGALFQAFIYLCAAVIAVPLAKRLGLGSVLGYLLAGIVIGPVSGLVGSETQAIQHVAEFGVVMMLFLVGLELQPRLLWEMRHRLFGLGGLQVVLTSALITGLGMLLKQPWETALTIGMILSLSSTAIVLQTLSEKGLNDSEGGRTAFSVLLFQDLAVIPMLAVIPLLAVAVSGEPAAGAASHESFTLVANLNGAERGAVMLAAIGLVLVGGHYMARPLFRYIASSRLREIFTAFALLLVIGIALLMTLVELSPALGTFLAGMVLANSEFRHELESDIEPFKGLLLGLFFITVGAGIDFAVLFDDFARIMALTVAVIILKGGVLYLLGLLFGLPSRSRWLLTLSLAQAGEFGFVLLSFSQQINALPAELLSKLSLVVALSMLLTPGLFLIYDRFAQSLPAKTKAKESGPIDTHGEVIVAGSGRFGQVVNRLLMASGVKTVVLDYEIAMIDMLGKFGIHSFYGDASRPDLLIAAGVESAKAVVIAIDDRQRAVEMTRFIKRNYPHVKVLARAYDVNHLYLLRQAGVDVAVRELFDASLSTGKEVLKALGLHPYRVEKMATAFRHHDEVGLNDLYGEWDEHQSISENKAILARAREHGKTLSSMLESDRTQFSAHSSRGWTPTETPAKKNDAEETGQ
ncbi:monovalent cation:proton antiporter-2 (CPA2) family protein [Granulosicoccaceae sp. 1_MG-2023]|nr:monovalent cation:proton antiporter-2 (CPA2) family protein [Granulosicoccaceae sp. 1_MG-2023]